MSETASGGLELDGVKVGYGETIVLEGISLYLAPGGTRVLGRNGSPDDAFATIMGRLRSTPGT
jgi:ABC-type branched-subunit amino acid transport system ATPase component